MLVFSNRREWHSDAEMNRFCWFLLCFTLWAANAHSAELDTRAVAFYYPWYGNPATDGRFANWNHAVAVRGEAPRSFPGGDDIRAGSGKPLGDFRGRQPVVSVCKQCDHGRFDRQRMPRVGRNRLHRGTSRASGILAHSKDRRQG